MLLQCQFDQGNLSLNRNKAIDNWFVRSHWGAPGQFPMAYLPQFLHFETYIFQLKAENSAIVQKPIGQILRLSALGTGREAQKSKSFRYWSTCPKTHGRTLAPSLKRRRKPYRALGRSNGASTPDTKSQSDSPWFLLRRGPAGTALPDHPITSNLSWVGSQHSSLGQRIYRAAGKRHPTFLALGCVILTVSSHTRFRLSAFGSLCRCIDRFFSPLSLLGCVMT